LIVERTGHQQQTAFDKALEVLPVRGPMGDAGILTGEWAKNGPPCILDVRSVALAPFDVAQGACTTPGDVTRHETEQSKA
jgi:hypothetical protein